VKYYWFASILIFFIVSLGLPLRSREIFNTGAFDCTREKELRTLTWKNTGFTFVRKAQLWLGMDVGTVADFGFMLVRDRDKTFLARGNWDHYAEPNGINGQIVDMDFAPDYILLLPGNTLTLYYHCQAFGADLNQGHAIVNLWSFP
jgi:hypothetical protein